MRLNGLPMPPSSNNMYATVGRRRIKSRETLTWERDTDRWALKNAQELIQARALLGQAVAKGEVIDIDAQFWFRYEKVLTIKGKPKKLDTSNRIKGLHDALARLLRIDDCHFWHGSFEKIPTTGVPYDFVDCTFSTRAIR